MSKDQSDCENLVKNCLNLYCSSHFGEQKNTHQPIFQKGTENHPTHLTLNSVFGLIYVMPINLGQIDHNLHNHVSDDIICKPPIETIFILGHKVHLGHAFLHYRPE